MMMMMMIIIIIIIIIIIKVLKFTVQQQTTKAQRENRGYCFYNLGIRWGWVVKVTRPGRFTPGKDPVANVQVTGWAPEPVWMGAENLAPQRDSIPGPSSP